MSKEDVKKFYDHVVSNPSSLKSLASASSVDDIYGIAVKDGAALGLRFTEAEAREWADANRPKPKADGELSDEHLEAVAGGKGGGGSISSTVSTVGDGIVSTVGDGINGVKNWFSSW